MMAGWCQAIYTQAFLGYGPENVFQTAGGIYDYQYLAGPWAPPLAEDKDV